MKTKNTRVRVKDIKSGRIIYTAHPFFGIRKTIVKSRPYMVKGIGLFYDCVEVFEDFQCKSESSIDGDGINSGDSSNTIKSFFKEKQAIEYMNKMKTDKRVVTSYLHHLDSCLDYDLDYECDYDHDDIYGS